jgi:hypothetical protein
VKVRRITEGRTYYYRLTPFLPPSYAMIPYQKGHSIHGTASTAPSSGTAAQRIGAPRWPLATALPAT